MKLNEMLEQVRVTCRMRRLSWQTEQCYAGWIARFARHVARCGAVTREAARKIEDMRTVIQGAHEAFKNLMDLTPNVPPWANTEATLAVAKLQSYLRS